MIRSLIVALVAAMALPAAASDLRVVSFGDSMSDVGNRYVLSEGQIPESPPNFKGRPSNGRVWTEILAGGPQRLLHQSIDNRKDANFAVVGAWVGTGGSVPSIPSQVDTYFSGGGRFKPTDVVTLWGGTNDLLNAIDRFDSDASAASAGKRTADLTSRVLVRLLKGGARRIVVMTTLPLDEMLLAFEDGTVRQFSKAVPAFNTRLQQQVAKAQKDYPNAKITVFDYTKWLSQRIRSPKKYGYIDGSSPCLFVTACASATVAKQNKYLLWDYFHLTTRGHARLAADVKRAIQ